MALTGLTNLQPLHIKTVGIGTFDNAVSIGGTLTYEDVTNVDAIGIITARSGVNVSGGQLDVGSNIKLGNAGVITATSFVGDGSGLTGAGPSLTGSTNNTIVTVTGANAIQGESTLTYDGTYLDIGGGVTRFTKQGSYNSLEIGFGQNGNQNAFIDLIGDTTYTDYGTRIIRNGQNGANAQTDILHRGTGSLNLQTSDAADIVLKTNGNNERLRLTSEGKLGVNITNPTTIIHANGNNTVGTSVTMTLQSHDTANATAGIDLLARRSDNVNQTSKILATSGGTNSVDLTFHTNNTEKLRITSDGQIKILGHSGNTGFFLSNAYSQASMLGGMYYNGSSWVRDAVGTRAPAGVFLFTGGHVAFLTAPETSGTTATPTEKVRITNTGQLFIGTTSGSEILCIKRDDAIGPSITIENNANKTYINNWGATGGGSGRTNRFEINATLASQASYCAPYHTFMTGGVGDAYEKVRIMPSGTLKALYHATSRNGIVQINQVTSETRYSGSASSVDLITGSTFTPKTSAPRFLIQIFCPVNTSDDSDAGNGNTNYYFYGRIEYRKNGGSWLECNNQGSTAEQGGYAAHIELSPNRTGPNTTDYWSGNRYRLEHKQATILVTNVGDCGSAGNVQFKLRSYSYTGNFIHIGQPHGYGTDDNYGVQPWGFTVFELAPDSNSYTAY